MTMHTHNDTTLYGLITYISIVHISSPSQLLPFLSVRHKTGNLSEGKYIFEPQLHRIVIYG